MIFRLLLISDSLNTAWEDQITVIFLHSITEENQFLKGQRYMFGEKSNAFNCKVRISINKVRKENFYYGNSGQSYSIPGISIFVITNF